MSITFSRHTLVAIGFLIGAIAPAQAQDEPRSYIMATAQEGGTYYPVGVALAVLSTIHLQANFGLEVTAVTSGGSLDNLQLMRSGEAQFGMLEVLAGTWARDGSGPLEETGPQENLRAISMLWPDVEHFLITTNLAETGTIDDLAGLEGRGFAMGPLGSGTEYTNAVLFENYGFDYTIWGPVFQTYDESAQALLDGAIAGVNIGSGIGVNSVTHIMTQMGELVTLLSVTDEQAERLDGGLGILSTTLIPPDTYPGVDAPLQTVALPNFLAVNAEVPDEDVYQFTRTMFENLEYLCSVHQAACALSLEGAQRGLPLDLHPGAARYFSEMGIEPVVETPPVTATE